MPFQAPAWTEFYACPICGNDFSNNQRLPISLGCGHTICRPCLGTVYNSQCPFDQTTITTDIDNLPINTALLQLFNSNNDEDKDKNKNSSIKNKVFSKSLTTSARTNGAKKVSNNNNNNSNNNKSININKNGDGFTHSYDNNRVPPSIRMLNVDDLKCYKTSKRCIEELAQYLKSFFLNNGNLLTRPMLRKIVALANCQLMEEEGRIRAIRTARLLGERTVTELLLQHQNPQQLSLYLWAAVRSRGCQFLGPAMQEEVLKLVLKALENGSALSRKVLVMYVVQRLVENLLPASKTSIGHVVQLLYRASCFKVSKREGDSSLMQLKEEFRNYEALRREHDAQIVQIATEAGLRIAPDQWSSLLYGNITHKSHMQSICDTLQSPSSFSQSVQELILALQRTGDPTNLFILRPHLKHLASIDTSLESSPPLWQDVENALTAVRHVVLGLVKFVQYHNNQNLQDYQTASANYNGKYKISLCRDHAKRRICPRGENCTFAHSTEERQRYRAKNRKSSAGKLTTCSTRSNNSDVEKETQLSSAVKSVTKGSPQHLKQPSHHHSLHTQNVMQTCNALSLHINSNTATSSPVKVRNSLKEQLATYENVNSNLSDIVGSGSGDDHTFGGLPLNVPFQKEEYYPTLHGDNRVSSICHQLEHEFNLQPSIPPPGHYHEANTTSFNSMDYNSGRSLNMLSVNGPNVIPRNTRESTSMIGIHTALSRRQANMTTVVTPPNSFSTLKTANSQSLFNQHTSNKTTTLFTNSLANYFYHNDAEENDERNAVMNGMSSSLFFNTKPLNANNIVSTIDVQATNTKFPLSLKSNIAHKASTNTWDAKSPEFNSIINSNDLLQTSHNRTFVTPKVPESKVFAIDKNLILENTAVIQSSDTFIIKNNNNSNLNNDLTKSRSSLLLWKSGNNLGTATEVGNATSTILNDNAVNIETSLFHDRESFVRSDSILDDDASTFDVPTTSTALGSKYGPICPMYKGLPSTTASTMTKVINRSVNDHPQTGDLGYTWDDLKIQTGSHNVINSIIPNDTNLSVFPMGNKVQSSSSSGFQDKVESVAGPSHVQSLISDASDSSDLQSVLSKLSCLDFNINNASNLIDNVCANGNGSITSNNNVPTTFEHTSSDAINVNNMKFDLSPLADILPSKTHTTDLKKTFNIDDGLIGTSVDYNHVTQQQQEQQKIHFNNFWSDNVSFPTESTNITLAPTAKIQQQSGQQQSYSNLSQEQYNHDKHKVEATSVADNRLDITDIVDRIWPCIDKNDNAYE